jgi:hypothetical protein
MEVYMKKLILIGLVITSLLGLGGCDKLDVIGTYSERSFEEVLNIMSDRVKEDTEFGGWLIEAPDQEVSFVWSKNFSETSPYDAKMIINAQPFLDAGLDLAKLPEGMLEGDKIVIGIELGEDDLSYEGEATPLEAYQKIVEYYRYNISYHASLDHFGVVLGNGNVFEWAKDWKTNDKDIVFVLNPQPFLDAGVNPEQLEGWVYAKVEAMDDKGKMIQVEKLLKPFNIAD